MHFLFTLARTYPYWAIPVAIVLFELGVFFKRRHNKVNHYLFWSSAGLVLFGLIFWFVYRGDLNSDEWVRTMSCIIPFDTSATFA